MRFIFAKPANRAEITQGHCLVKTREQICFGRQQILVDQRLVERSDSLFGILKARGYKSDCRRRAASSSSERGSILRLNCSSRRERESKSHEPSVHTSARRSTSATCLVSTCSAAAGDSSFCADKPFKRSVSEMRSLNRA